ncbi:MAG: hypothetical protein WC749_02155 [Dehalococcoidia bacterium]
MAGIMDAIMEIFQPQAKGGMADFKSPEYIGQILNQNKDKNFVQRILTPDTSPVLVDYAGPGTHGTHLMASGEYGGKGIVYPEIIQGKDGNLKRLDRKEAGDYAIKNKEYIEFPTSEQAESFGKNYKRVWGGEFNNQGQAGGS